MSEADLQVIAEGFAFLEVPRWREGLLWTADMYAGQVLAIAENGRVETVLDVPGTPAGLGWMPDGRLLVLLREGHLLRRDEDGFAEICDLTGLGPAPPNELSVDDKGRVFIGLFGLATGRLIRVGPGRAVHTAAMDLSLPNGQAITPDGTALIVAESGGQRLTAFTLQPDGRLTSRRVWASFGKPATATTLPAALAQVSVWPDGITLDASGAAWVANPIGHEVLRVLEGGQITDRISTGDRRCVACALGGRDGHTLFLCTTPPAPDHAQMTRNRQATLLTIRVAIGAPASNGAR